MLKKSVLYFSVLTLMFMQSSFATDSAELNFATIGGPSMVGQMSSDMLDANLIHDAAVKYSKNDRNKSVYGKSYSNSNKQNNVYNVKDNTKYTFKRGSLDTEQGNDMYKGSEYSGGVNASKTMYTDELGRLHFFGKGNLIKE